MWNVLPCYCQKNCWGFTRVGLYFNLSCCTYLAVAFSKMTPGRFKKMVQTLMQHASQVHFRKVAPWEQMCRSRTDHMHGHKCSTCHKCVITKASGSFSCSKQLSIRWLHVSHCLNGTIAKVGKDECLDWRKTHQSQAGGCCFSKAFCPWKKADSSGEKWEREESTVDIYSRMGV